MRHVDLMVGSTRIATLVPPLTEIDAVSDTLCVTSWVEPPSSPPMLSFAVQKLYTSPETAHALLFPHGDAKLPAVSVSGKDLIVFAPSTMTGLSMHPLTAYRVTSLKRKRDKAMLAEAVGENPWTAVLRDEAILSMRRRMAAAVRRCGPLNSRTKTARAVRRQGLMEGLQGMFARWIFKQLSERQQTESDPLITVHCIEDIDVMNELVEAGLRRSDALFVHQTLEEAASDAVATIARRAKEGIAKEVTSETQGSMVVLSIDAGPSLRIHCSHLDKLKRFYQHKTPFVEKLFLERVFCMLQRYETLSGGSSGYQGALPDHVFVEMQRSFGIACECFASPLNCFFPSFCSAFTDVDAPFGSHGSFFHFYPTTGSFESNPPFVDLIMTRNVEHIHHLLAASAKPLSFLIVVPAWDDVRPFA